MEVTALFLAEYAAADQLGRVNAIGIFNQIVATELPVQLPPLCLAAMFDMTGVEPTAFKNLTIQLRGGDPEEVYMSEEIPMDFSGTPTPDGSPMTTAQMVAGIGKGPELKTEGLYILDLYIDKEHKYRTSFRVHLKGNGRGPENDTDDSAT